MVLDSSQVPLEISCDSNIYLVPELSPDPTDDSSPPPDDLNGIVDTEYFEVPFAPATVNAASIYDTTPYADVESDALITDPLHYLSYES